MKFSPIVRTFVLAALAIAICVAPALAESFTLHNKTSEKIVALYVSPTSMNSWGNNILSETVAAGHDATFTWNKNAPDECDWDVRAEFADKSYAEVKNVDFCSTDEVTFHD